LKSAILGIVCIFMLSSILANGCSAIANKPNFRNLSDQQKAELIAIASQNSEVRQAVSSNPNYQTGLVWVGVLNNGGYATLPYEQTIEKGAPTDLAWVKDATFYPGVNFNFGSFVITAAVDLDKKQVVFVTRGQIKGAPKANN
jgi:hypothetical protein